MPVLTAAAVLALANACVGPSLAPVMTAIAMHESGGNTTAAHLNSNGTRDLGLVQVNEINWKWTGLTEQTALDPCANLRAGAKVLLAKYNGNAPDTVKATYTADVIAKIPATPITIDYPPPTDDPELNDEPGAQIETFFTGDHK